MVTNNERYKRKIHHSYEKCSEYERSKLAQGYKRIKKYAYFYLYGKYDINGNLLYKECFSIFDVEGPKTQRRQTQGTYYR